MDLTEQLKIAARWLHDADGILVIAGAEMNVDSGLLDFRCAVGFWRTDPALNVEGTGFRDIASSEAFRRDPASAWGFYGRWLNLYRRTIPHEGFEILRRWASTKEHGAFVFTSNVDGQFQKAGFEAKRILEYHGTLHRLQCSRPCSPDTWSADDLHPEVNDERCRLVSALPRCLECGSVARPNILMLNDNDWNDYAIRRRRLRFEAWLAGVERMAIIEVGAVQTAPSVHGVPEMTRSQVIRINRPADAIDPKRSINICGGALGILRQLNGFV